MTLHSSTWKLKRSSTKMPGEYMPTCTFTPQSAACFCHQLGTLLVGLLSPFDGMLPLGDPLVA